MIRAVAASAEINAIRKLCACRSVKKIFLDHQVRGNLNIATPAVGSASVRSNLRLSGRRVSIAILDTGVFPHPDLVKPTNRILVFRDLINRRRSRQSSESKWNRSCFYSYSRLTVGNS